jgi:COMPASS component SWD1
LQAAAIPRQFALAIEAIFWLLEGYVYEMSAGHCTKCSQLDGVVIVFDVETNAVARKLRGHIRQIQSLSWSTSDRYLLSTSLDCKAILWDLETGDRLRMVRFTGPIFFAELHPSN